METRRFSPAALAPTDLEDLDGLVLAPVTFQENVEKSSDIRVTVVGEEVFAAENHVPGPRVEQSGLAGDRRS